MLSLKKKKIIFDDAAIHNSLFRKVLELNKKKKTKFKKEKKKKKKSKSHLLYYKPNLSKHLNTQSVTSMPTVILNH